MNQVRLTDILLNHVQPDLSRLPGIYHGTHDGLMPGRHNFIAECFVMICSIQLRQNASMISPQIRYEQIAEGIAHSEARLAAE
jgi:hypothetical protein